MKTYPDIVDCVNELVIASILAILADSLGGSEESEMARVTIKVFL
jgi:hypothetical protein